MAHLHKPRKQRAAKKMSPRGKKRGGQRAKYPGASAIKPYLFNGRNTLTGGR